MKIPPVPHSTIRRGIAVALLIVAVIATPERANAQKRNPGPPVAGKADSRMPLKLLAAVVENA